MPGEAKQDFISSAKHAGLKVLWREPFPTFKVASAHRNNLKHCKLTGSGRYTFLASNSLGLSWESAIEIFLKLNVVCAVSYLP